MGTRAYAECVCKIIDPARKIFANRILSRDESGSEWIALKSVEQAKETYRLVSQVIAEIVSGRPKYGCDHR